MIFWRKKTNEKEQDQEARDEKLIHPKDEPALEPSTDYEAEINPDFRHKELEEHEQEILEELEIIPTPQMPSLEESSQNSGGGWFSKLSEGLKKTTSKLDLGLSDLLSKRNLDEQTLEELEEILILADLGPHTAAHIIEKLRAQKFDKNTEPSAVKKALAEIIADILQVCERPLAVKTLESYAPRVLMITGVNGVGKTTTIGKLAYQLHFKQDKKIMLAAADTFRAAAIEQLQIWADRAKAQLIAKEIGSDSASVAFEAYTEAVNEGADLLLIDTAGRLHNKTNLMAELEKIIRVLRKKDEHIPHEILLIVDATTGQNAVQQVKTFQEIVGVTGLIVTKLDGSAKGGVVVALANQFKLPIYAVGVGEGIEDLQAFNANAFARALIGVED